MDSLARNDANELRANDARLERDPRLYRHASSPYLVNNESIGEGEHELKLWGSRRVRAIMGLKCSVQVTSPISTSKAGLALEGCLDVVSTRFQALFHVYSEHLKDLCFDAE